MLHTYWSSVTTCWSCEPYPSGSLLLRCKNEVQVFLKPAYFSSKSPCMICAGSLLWTEYSRSSQCRGCTRPWRRSCPQNDNALMGVFIEVCQHHGRSTELCKGWKLYRWVVQCIVHSVSYTWKRITIIHIIYVAYFDYKRILLLSKHVPTWLAWWLRTIALRTPLYWNHLQRLEDGDLPSPSSHLLSPKKVLLTSPARRHAFPELWLPLIKAFSNF